MPPVPQPGLAERGQHPALSASAADGVVLAAMANGDAAALGLLYDRYARRVYSLALHLLRSPELAEAVTEDTFLALWQGEKPSQPTPDSISAWLLRSAHQRACALQRREPPHPGSHAVVDERARAADARSVRSSTTAEDMRQALIALPLLLREPLELATRAGATYREIAEQLGIAPGEAARRLRDGLRQLAEHLPQEGVLVMEPLATSLGEPPIAPGAPAGSDPSGEPVGLAAVLITDALAQRRARPPDLQAENAALHRLAGQMAMQSDGLLDTLVQLAVTLCGAGTAGLSLLDTTPDGEEVFRWAVMAGTLASAVGGTTPRAFSPCGVTLDRHAAQLFHRPSRYFTYFDQVPVPIHEGLVIPLYAEQRPLGTLWVVSHTEDRQFDWEDARVLTSLAHFTSIALQLQTSAAESTRHSQLAQVALADHNAVLSSVAHDLRSPLTVIVGAAQLLEQHIVRDAGPAAASLLARLQLIHQGCSSLRGMVGELADLAQLESGEPLVLHCAPTDLVALVQRCQHHCQELASRHTMTVTASAPSCVGWWDAARLERVFVNLLSNALKFSPAGGRIELTVTPEQERAVVTVRDRGLGIPAADLPHIFERFYRVAATAGRIPGSGIGLAVVQQLVARHGGTIAVESSEGEGTVFTVHLPLAGPAAASPV